MSEPSCTTVLQAVDGSRGYVCAPPYQDADDMIARPVSYVRTDPDNTVEKTFGIRGPWSLVPTEPLGELVVREAPTGALIKIFLGTDE